LPGHYTRKTTFFPSSKPEGNHANLLTLSFHFQIEVLIGIKVQKTPTEFHTDPHNTKLEGYGQLHLHRLLQHPHKASITM